MSKEHPEFEPIPPEPETRVCLSCGAVVQVDENGELPEGLPCGH